MADYKELFGGAVNSLVGKLKETAQSTGVADVYAQGAERAKAYARITKLTLEQNSDNAELGRVYAEIGRLYFEQNRRAPEGFFAPLFAQAERLTEGIRAREAEINALKNTAGSGEPDIEVEISDFEEIVNATEADGTKTD